MTTLALGLGGLCAAICCWALSRCRHRHLILRRNERDGRMGLECQRCGQWFLHPGWSRRVEERRLTARTVADGLASIERAERRERAKLAVLKRFGGRNAHR